MQESQLFARKFAKTFNCKWGGKQFTIQIGLAKNLLKSYPYDDLDLLLDYIKEYPLKNKIFSIAYLRYIIDDTLPKAKAWKYNKALNARKQFEPQTITVVNKKKKTRSSMFNNCDF